MLISAPPMELGQTLDGIDANSVLTNIDKLGMRHTFPNYPKTGGPTRSKSLTDAVPITAILMRNTSGITLLGGRLGQVERTAGYGMVKNVHGYSTTAGNKAVVLIDPFLPSSGVADKDIFWGLIRGVVKILLPLAGSDHIIDIAVNDALCAATGTTTGATTSGRVTHVRFANATAGGTEAAQSGFNMAYACIGRALSARTSQETTAGADLLVDLNIRVFAD